MAKKLNFGLIIDKIFRRTLFLRPLPDKSLEAIDITGSDNAVLRDKTGATTIDTSCIVRVRGLKRVDYLAFKLADATALLNIFDTEKIVVKPPNVNVKLPEGDITNEQITVTIPEQTVTCSVCGAETIAPMYPLNVDVPPTHVSIPEFEVEVPSVEVVIPSESVMTEKTFGDMLNNIETAGKMQAERNPETDKKMNMILIAAGIAALAGIVIFFKINSGGA